MCGIVGAVSQRDIVPILIEGLRRLEYRGYDSCGVAVHPTAACSARAARRAWPSSTPRRTNSGPSPASRTRAGPRTARRHRTTRIRTFRPARCRRVAASTSPHAAPASRWCTTASSRTTTSCVRELRAAGYVFESQTDTEVIAHLIDSLYDGDLFDAVQRAVRELRGAYAIAVFCRDEPHRVVGARAGSPLVVGVGARRELPRLRRDGAGRRDRPDRLPRGRRRRRPAAGRVWIVDATARPVTREVRTVNAGTAARPSWGRTATTCKRRSSSSRARSPTRSTP